MWASIAAAAVGIVGVLIGQWISGMRDDRRWKREVERENERWVREHERDQARWHVERDLQVGRLRHETRIEWRTQRVEYYTRFLDALKSVTDPYEGSIFPGYIPDAAITAERYGILRETQAAIEIVGELGALEVSRKILNRTFSMHFVPLVLAVTVAEDERQSYENQYTIGIKELIGLKAEFIQEIRAELSVNAFGMNVGEESELEN